MALTRERNETLDIGVVVDTDDRAKFPGTFNEIARERFITRLVHIEINRAAISGRERQDRVVVRRRFLKRHELIHLMRHAKTPAEAREDDVARIADREENFRVRKQL